tara:strand:- start:2104 stop:2364 length:261 start_codon:yes stop_codon:yes gene_type:complete
MIIGPFSSWALRFVLGWTKYATSLDSGEFGFTGIKTSPISLKLFLVTYYFFLSVRKILHLFFNGIINCFIIKNHIEKIKVVAVSNL